MSASVITFPQTERAQSATIITNGDRRAAVAAERTGRNAKEIERLPFDLSVLEEEGLFVNVDATGFGILDRRLDWQALGVELPEETDVAFRPPRCGLLPNRYRRPLLTPVSQSHAALHKYSYHFRLTETLFESPAYRWVPWQAFTEFETVFNKACDNLNKAKQTVLDAKRALSIATTLRGILGISEFEKAVGGLESSSRTDGGETARTIAYLLNWMQEQSDVFVIGTANDVRGLAAEQTRQGRFSHIVFVDLPTLDDRREIFAVHLRKRNREPEEFDLDELAEVTEGYSGAEIEAAVKAGLLRAFMDGERWLMTEDIVECARRIQPTSVVKREQVESLRNWAKDHMAVDAGGIGVTPIGERMNGARALEM